MYDSWSVELPLSQEQDCQEQLCGMHHETGVYTQHGAVCFVLSVQTAHPTTQHRNQRTLGAY